MGNPQSSQVSSFINSCVSITTNVINQNITNNHIECTAVNNMNITFGPSARIIVHGNVDMSQKANVDMCDMVSAISTSVNNDFESKIQNEIDNLMDQEQKSTTGFLATAFSSQSSVQDFKANLHTAISKTFVNSNISTCAVSARAVNNETLEFNGYVEVDGNWDFSQAAQVQASAKCIVDNVISNLDKSIIDSITSNTQSSKQTAESRGPFESLGNFLQQMMLPLIICAVITALIGGVFLMMKLGGGSGSASQSSFSMTPPGYGYPGNFPPQSRYP